MAERKDLAVSVNSIIRLTKRCERRIENLETEQKDVKEVMVALVGMKAAANSVSTSLWFFGDLYMRQNVSESSVFQEAQLSHAINVNLSFVRLVITHLQDRLSILGRDGLKGTPWYRFLARSRRGSQASLLEALRVLLSLALCNLNALNTAINMRLTQEILELLRLQIELGEGSVSQAALWDQFKAQKRRMKMLDEQQEAEQRSIQSARTKLEQSLESLSDSGSLRWRPLGKISLVSIDTTIEVTASFTFSVSTSEEIVRELNDSRPPPVNPMRPEDQTTDPTLAPMNLDSQSTDTTPSLGLVSPTFQSLPYNTSDLSQELAVRSVSRVVSRESDRIDPSQSSSHSTPKTSSTPESPLTPQIMARVYDLPKPLPGPWRKYENAKPLRRQSTRQQVSRSSSNDTDERDKRAYRKEPEVGVVRHPLSDDRELPGTRTQSTEIEPYTTRNGESSSSNGSQKEQVVEEEPRENPRERTRREMGAKIGGLDLYERHAGIDVKQRLYDPTVHHPETLAPMDQKGQRRRQN